MWREQAVGFAPGNCLTESVAHGGIAINTTRHAQRKDQALCGTGGGAALGEQLTTRWKFALLQRPLPRVEVGGVPTARDAIKGVCAWPNSGNAGALPVEGVVL